MSYGEKCREYRSVIMKIMLTDIHGIIIIMSWKLRVFPIFRSNYENNFDRNIDPRERPKFSRHYVIYSLRPGINLSLVHSFSKLYLIKLFGGILQDWGWLFFLRISSLIENTCIFIPFKDKIGRRNVLLICSTLFVDSFRLNLDSIHWDNQRSSPDL